MWGDDCSLLLGEPRQWRAGHNWGLERDGLQKPADVVDDGGITERAQNSCPTPTLTGCTNLDKTPACCLGPKAPVIKMDVTMCYIKSTILSL